MAKAMKHSDVARELKKDYLRDHLESVKSLIRDWMSELRAPSPLSPKDHIWGWQSLYHSTRLDDPDDNHMLRRHLKSRALWSHHSSWEQKLGEIWQLTERVRKEAEAMKESIKGPWKYTEDYAPVALWKAFDVVLGKATDLPFIIPHDQMGLSYGGYLIETSANTRRDRLSIEEEYKRFVRDLSQTPTLKQLADSWLEANQLETQMLTIISKILKSGNIFYVCRYCRHLWV